MRNASDATALVARRYLEHGFLDAAMRLFMRHPAAMHEHDWSLLVERLMERQRIVDAVRACEAGGVALPRERLLALGDELLRRRDYEGTARLYELGAADRERWARLVDLLTALPDQERRAVDLARRHLVFDAPDARLVAAS
ncbi:MAG TPA: hypothetical protein VKW76_11190 [Candidatus Binatia bacterium]|nr:hypothetical protein [Candidatus Binatia bacterium]